MKKLFGRVLACALIFSVAGCGSTWSTSSIARSGEANAGTASHPGRALSDIVVTESDVTDHKYRVIGDISVNVNKTTIFDEDPTRAKVDEKLRDEAAKLGADAVVLVRYGSVGVGLMSWGSLDGKGRAIVFTD